MEQNKSWFSLDLVKGYFDVTNTYVLHKLRMIFIPFSVKGEDGWKPKGVDIGSGQGYESDTERDLQTPDLYIPLMSIVTFILLVGLKLGQNNT